MEQERSNKGKKFQRLLDARKLLGQANTADVAYTAMPSKLETLQRKQPAVIKWMNKDPLEYFILGLGLADQIQTLVGYGQGG